MASSTVPTSLCLQARKPVTKVDDFRAQQFWQKLLLNPFPEPSARSGADDSPAAADDEELVLFHCPV